MTRFTRFVIVALLLQASLPLTARAHSDSQATGAQPSPSSSGLVARAQLVINGVVARLVQPYPGEICLVCNKPLGAHDEVYEVEGQRLPVHLPACDAELHGHPQVYLSRLKPFGEAFLGSETGLAGLADAWLVVGLYVLAGLIFGAICAHRSLHVGYSPGAGFALGLFLNVLGYVFVLTRPRREVQAPAGVPGGLRKISATHAPELCPHCGMTNHPAAHECVGCGGTLSPRVASEVERAGLRKA